ncbi:MAG: amidase family protein [Planktotalea sp.]|uniref:amidase n=1 Tax=Planktotalea sp. TaxID=2029877 RepID=UPI003C7536E3
MQDWLKMSAAALGRGIESGDIDPVSLAETYLDAATSHPMSGRIYARLTPERALSEAKAAANRAKAGQRRSLLDGVPISWKDLFDTAGVATEAGSALLKDRIPTRDAEVLRVATSMGTVCIGKTHMSELAFSGLGYNPITETAPCVHDPDAVSGGSSSGAAASVAHNIAPLAIGSDTGGSVRIPSVWNDLVGLKTTAGRLTLEGVVPLVKSFDTIGPLARTVEDAALALGILEGTRGPDLAGASLAGTHFGVLKTLALDDVEDQPRTAFESAIQRLQAAGAQISTIEAPEVLEAISHAGPLFPGEAYGIWRDAIEANPDVMFAQVLGRFRAGADFSAPDYVAAWETLHKLRDIWNARIAGFDAVLTPSCPIMPPKIADLAADEPYYVERNLKTLRNTRIGNLMGSCSLTLPTGLPSCGIMLTTLPLHEERLLRLGAAAEAALA